MYIIKKKTKKLKHKAMRTKILTISRFLFGAVTILHVCAILIWFMIPREQIIYIAQKSFYPPFIHSYAVKYQEAKDSYTKVQKKYNNKLDFLEEWAAAKCDFAEKEHELVGYVLLNTFIMTVIFLVCWIILHEKLGKTRIKKELEQIISEEKTKKSKHNRRSKV